MSDITESQIQLFIRGYLTAALWSSTDTLPSSRDEDGEGEGETVNLDNYDWAPGEAEKLHEECRDFINYATADLLLYADQYAPAQGYDVWECAGHDFWLTRNGHGAGFWDRGLDELGTRLTEACKTFGTIDLYLGDDELVYS